MYRDLENGKIYATKEEAKKDYLNILTSTSWGLTEIIFDCGLSRRSILEWIEKKGLLKEFYFTFQEKLNESAEQYAEEWLEDLEEIEEE